MLRFWNVFRGPFEEFSDPLPCVFLRRHALLWRTSFCWILMGNVLLSNTSLKTGQRIVPRKILRKLCLPRLRRPMLARKVHNFLWYKYMMNDPAMICRWKFVCLVYLTAEIAMFENNIVVYKFVQDLHFFVTGGDYENELILATVLQAFFDSVGLLLRLLS